MEYALDKDYGVAIATQLYLGLRVGELIALRWEDLDLKEGMVHIRATYVRKEKRFKDFPKGGKQHTKAIPEELLSVLREEKLKSASEYVATSPKGKLLSYEWYFRTLKGYCRRLDIPEIGTHGLRHSTSEVYLTSGATKDDIRQLFAHSSPLVTDRYIHGRTNLSRVAKVIRLLPSERGHGHGHAIRG